MNTYTKDIQHYLHPWLTKIRESLLKQPPDIPDESQLMVLARYNWEVGRIHECLSCVRLMELRDTVTFHELQFRGYWELYKGDAMSALKTFSAALEQDKHDFATRLGYAYALFYLKDYRSAETIFQRLCDDGAPLHSPPVMAAASRAMAAGQRPSEIQMAPIPGLPPGLADLLQNKLLNGPEDTIIQAQTSLSRTPPQERLPIGRLLVEIYLEEGQNKQALYLINELMRAHENDGPLHFFKGIALRRLGQLQESQHSFSKAVELAPLDARPWGALAAGWVELQEYQKSIDTFGVAVFLDDENPNFWGDLGMAESVLEYYEKAMRSFSKSIELGLNNFSNYFNRGICALNLENFEAAIRDLRLAITAEPDHPRANEAKSLIENLGGGTPDNRFVFGNS